MPTTHFRKYAVSIAPQLVTGIGCFLVSALMIRFFGFNGNLASIWPANAIILAQLLGRPRQEWSGFLLSGFIAMAGAGVYERHITLGPILVASGNVVEIAMAAWLLTDTLDKGRLLHRHASVGRFVLCAGIIAPSCGAAISAMSAATMLHMPLLPAFFTKFAADSLGMLVFTPFFFGLVRGHAATVWRETPSVGRTQMLLFFAVTFVVSAGIFVQDRYPLLFIPMVPLILLAFRFGWMGTSVGVMLVAVPSMIATYHGLGPISSSENGIGVQIAFLQFYLATILLLVMPVAAALQARRDLIDRLRESERALTLLAERSAIVLLRFAKQGDCTRVVGDSAKLLGLDADVLLGRALELIAPPLGHALNAAHGMAVESRSTVTSEIAMADGRWVEAIFRLEHDDNGDISGTVATLSDVTTRKTREGELSQQAKTDELTGLANRAGFKHRFDAALAGNQSMLSVALIDIDQFKLLNDGLGHLAGDAVLAEIGRRILVSVRSTDLVARLGGDEFVVLLADTDEAGARATCMRIVAAVSGAPVQLPGGAEVNSAVSCGLAHALGGESGTDLLERADRALYSAKRAGRNQLIAA